MSIEELSLISYNDQILSDGTLNNNQDSISRCKMSIDKVSPSSNTNQVFNEKSENAYLNYLIECDIDGSYEVDIQNNTIRRPTHKRKILHSNELIATDNDNKSNCSHGIPKDQSCFENIKKRRIVDDMIHIAGQTSKYYQEFQCNIILNGSEIEYFKKTYKKFLQKSICLTLPSQIDKCVECHDHLMKNNFTRHDYNNMPCRFYGFRQLRFEESGILEVAGFPDPHKDIENNDMSMWLPSSHSSNPSDFNIQTSERILSYTGNQFCKLVKDEIDALKLNMTYKKKPRQILWKKIVNGIREMCDVCKTTIFNYHFCCQKCGFEVCIDCYKAKIKRILPLKKQRFSQRHLYAKIPLLCSNQKKHNFKNLFLTQILPGDALKIIANIMLDTCRTRNIHLECSCNETLEKEINSNSIDPPNLKHLLNIYNRLQGKPSELNTFRGKVDEKSFSPRLSLLSDGDILSSYMWLCDGQLLRLLDPKRDDNYTIFQAQWKLGKPVLVSGVGNKLNSSLWHPESFSRDFGNQINDLIDCRTSNFISDKPMSMFWNGFENSEKRLCDEQGNEMLLKLKDWPTSADFADTLPDRFQDLMNCLPLKEYTHRNGKYNLASMLPDYYVRPDLGPKMYTAYGSAGTIHKKVGTTNLHLDPSDAVNVMVYVAITRNSKEYDYDWYVKEAFKVIEEAGCDDLTLRRIHEHGEIPGALWHIYHTSDTDTIRNFLIKDAIDQGIPLNQITDPIHDQSFYLDKRLRECLYREHGIKGYAVVQFYGDAVFIPAGAPHQVRNLHNCIKVAEEFVSPENVRHSFRMTQEFRYLTDNHTNHEDMLQIKNILFHTIKNSISVLQHTSQEP